MAMERVPEIRKEGLSEYFLYTIEGAQTIPNGWSKRLESFTAAEVPVLNLYKHDPARFGQAVVRYLSFTNDAEHNLGETPIPGGQLKAYRRVDDAAHLSYEGQSSFKYIPVGEEIELNLGQVEDIVVEENMIAQITENYRFEARHGDISGWDEIRTFEVTVKNTRGLPVRIELRRHLDTQYWQLQKTGAFGKYEKIDMETVQFTLELPPRSEKKFTYTVRTFQGDRTQDWQPTEGHETALEQ
jgi:hypothetical protein